MVQKIIRPEELKEVVKSLHTQRQRLVLVGGCFDILHQGHIRFLTEAKKQGDTLIVLLESDQSIWKRKGPGKPVNTQKARAQILSSVPVVDYIVLLTDGMSHDDYDKVVLIVKPAIIATTKGDPARLHKERQAELLGAIVVDVIERLPEFASSKLAERIKTA